MARQLSSLIVSWESMAAAKLRQSRHYALAIAFYIALFPLFFSPVLFHGRFLAVGDDALYNFLPYFHSKKVLWDTLVFGGFPMMADPTAMSWYPVAWIFSLLGSWNLFMIAALVSGSFFTYGYVYCVSDTPFAALVAGTMFGLSGFMIAHLGHPHIVQSAAWIPLLIWSLETQRKFTTARWFVIGSASTALAFLGGQPQVFSYGLILAVVYMLVMGGNASLPRRRYYPASLLMILLGIGLAAIQMIPTIELANATSRAGYTFVDYASHSLPPRQLLTLVFPFAFGGPLHSAFLPYFGAPNETELAGYVGLLPLILTAAALVDKAQRRLLIFWISVAVVSLLLAMGDATPLARVIFYLPILKSFRAPGRHFFEFTLAASVLSGLGIARLACGAVSKTATLKIAIGAVVVILLSVVVLVMISAEMKVLAVAAGSNDLSVMPWRNRAVGAPLIIFVLVIATFLFWRGEPLSRFRRALLLALIVVDLGSFGWFFEWRYAALSKIDLATPGIDLRYRDLVNRSHQRLMPLRIAGKELKAVQPNLSRLWGVASADGYDALALARTTQILDVNERGDSVTDIWKSPSSGFDVLAVRYIFMSAQQRITDAAGVHWYADDWQQWLGEGCDPAGRTAFTISLPAAVKSGALGVVSRLACSTSVTDGTEVARLRMIDANEQVTERSLIAGRDTSEWAYDCPNVRPVMRHSRATIFSDYPAKMYDQACHGHFYVTKLNLDGLKEVKRLEFEWVKNPASLIVEKLSLIDEATGNSYPLDPALTQPQRWRFVEETPEARVYENLRALPRVWLTNEVQTVTADEALQAIKSGTLKDGRAFNPRQIALIEEPADFASSQPDNASATVTWLNDTRLEVHTVSNAPTFLLTSDTYYPGWRAMIDGHETRLYRADYAIRGVVVPAGQHLVSFLYRPPSFYAGATLSVCLLVTLVAIALWWRPRTRT